MKYILLAGLLFISACGEKQDVKVQNMKVYDIEHPPVEAYIPPPPYKPQIDNSKKK